MGCVKYEWGQRLVVTWCEVWVFHHHIGRLVSYIHPQVDTWLCLNCHHHLEATLLYQRVTLLSWVYVNYLDNSLHQKRLDMFPLNLIHALPQVAISRSGEKKNGLLLQGILHHRLKKGGIRVVAHVHRLGGATPHQARSSHHPIFFCLATAEHPSLLHQFRIPSLVTSAPILQSPNFSKQRSRWRHPGVKTSAVPSSSVSFHIPPDQWASPQIAGAFAVQPSGFYHWIRIM